MPPAPRRHAHLPLNPRLAGRSCQHHDQRDQYDDRRDQQPREQFASAHLDRSSGKFNQRLLHALRLHAVRRDRDLHRLRLRRALPAIRIGIGQRIDKIRILLYISGDFAAHRSISGDYRERAGFARVFLHQHCIGNIGAAQIANFQLNAHIAVPANPRRIRLRGNGQFRRRVHAHRGQQQRFRGKIHIFARRIRSGNAPAQLHFAANRADRFHDRGRIARRQIDMIGDHAAVYIVRHRKIAVIRVPAVDDLQRRLRRRSGKRGVFRAEACTDRALRHGNRRIVQRQHVYIPLAARNAVGQLRDGRAVLRNHRAVDQRAGFPHAQIFQPARVFAQLILHAQR